MALRIYTGARGSQFVCDDTRGFGDAIAGISIRADAPISSCAREEAAEPQLRQIGKMSQKQLWECSRNCRPGCNGNCNPANPPGLSTHERRNDGVAYPRWRRGAFVRYWMRGIDVARDRVAAFIREAAEEGWLVTQTYPGSIAEAQHVNFRRRPRISLWEFRPLERGMRGGRVREVVRHLRTIQEPGKRTPYLTGKGGLRRQLLYTKQREAAVKRFQRDHHIRPDGVVGLRTITVLRGTARRPPSRLDQAGIDFLIEFEGEILHAYNDLATPGNPNPPNGNATFGVGRLLHEGPLTAADVDRFGSKEHPKPAGEMRRLSRRFLDEDVREHELAVMRHVPLRWRRSQDRVNCFSSGSLNLGTGYLTPEPRLVSLGQALQRRGVAGRRAIAAAILLFDKGGNPPRQLAGLTRRRRAERALFLRNR